MTRAFVNTFAFFVGLCLALVVVPCFADCRQPLERCEKQCRDEGGLALFHCAQEPVVMRGGQSRCTCLYDYESRNLLVEKKEKGNGK